jgi:hypothetical protein
VSERRSICIPNGQKTTVTRVRWSAAPVEVEKVLTLCGRAYDVWEARLLRGPLPAGQALRPPGVCQSCWRLHRAGGDS